MNPYESPAGTSTAPSAELPADRSLSRRATVSAILLVVGVLSLLVLDGRVFTHSVICATLFGVSGLMWVPLAMSKESKSDLARRVVLGHVVIMVPVIVSMPGNYVEQREMYEHFEKTDEALRKKAAEK